MGRAMRAATCLFAALAAAPVQAATNGFDDCPSQPNWSDYREMVLTPMTLNGETILLAEGRVDPDLPERLHRVLTANPMISEIWLRSPGGDARAGNVAGLIIRELGMNVITRIPSGWACFSACNFIFMGGRARVIDPGGIFMVHMFTMTGDRSAIQASVELGPDATRRFIGEIEQDAALLATEDNDFLIRMGVSRKLLSEVMYRQTAVTALWDKQETRRCLTLEEARRYNVVNQTAD
jgi:hypothetical protein